MSALWRSKRLLLLSALSALALILITTTHERFEFSGALLRLAGVRSLPRTTKPYFPPLAQGCPRLSENGTSDDESKIPCWDADTAVDLADVKIVMKTGIAERSKTQAFLDTFGSCIPNVLIVSDASYDVGNHKVIDVLADLPDSYTHDNPDWAIYAAQREALKEGVIPDKTPEGWRLDRFKFLPMVERAFEEAPQAKWYVFIEADIYYFWDTLFRVLSTLDPKQRYYLGSPAPGSDGRWFAYGGGGTVLSHKLVHDLLEGGQRKISAMPRYRDMAVEDCCGDAVLAYAIYDELGVRLKSLYPTFSGEELPWLAIDKEKWCVPLLGMHRIGPDVMRRLWRWERCRPPTKSPITYATFLDFILPHPLAGSPRSNWNNGAREALPPEDSAHYSPEACQSACAENKTCLQYAYSQDTCHMADRVMGGAPGDEVVSGWDFSSLEKLGYRVQGNPGDFCAQAKWLIPYNP